MTHPTKEEIAKLVAYIRDSGVPPHANFRAKMNAVDIALKLEPMREALERAQETIDTLRRSQQGLAHGEKSALELYGLERIRAEAAEVARDALRERVKELRGALAPFGKADHSNPNEDCREGALNVGAMFTYADLRRARAALAKDDK